MYLYVSYGSSFCFYTRMLFCTNIRIFVTWYTREDVRVVTHLLLLFPIPPLIYWYRYFVVEYSS